MRQIGDAEMMIGVRDAELLEEYRRHARIEVLAGVDDALLESVAARAFWAAIARLTVAALMNWGRAPTMVSRFMAPRCVGCHWVCPISRHSVLRDISERVLEN